MSKAMQKVIRFKVSDDVFNALSSYGSSVGLSAGQASRYLALSRLQEEIDKAGVIKQLLKEDPDAVERMISIIGNLKTEDRQSSGTGLRSPLSDSVVNPFIEKILNDGAGNTRRSER